MSTVTQIYHLARELQDMQRKQAELRPVIAEEIHAEIAQCGKACDLVADELLNNADPHEFQTLVAHVAAYDKDGLWTAFRSMVERYIDKVIDDKTEELATLNAEQDAAEFASRFA